MLCEPALRILGFRMCVRDWRHLNHLIADEVINSDFGGNELLRQFTIAASAHGIETTDHVYGLTAEAAQGRSRRKLRLFVLVSIAHQMVSQFRAGQMYQPRLICLR